VKTLLALFHDPDFLPWRYSFNSTILIGLQKLTILVRFIT
jgi:hypothetical protein